MKFQVWQLGSSSPNFTLEGHEKGVNCIDYYSGGDKPYLISGADDRQVKIWDYQVWSHSSFYKTTYHVIENRLNSLRIYTVFFDVSSMVSSLEVSYTVMCIYLTVCVVE